MPHVRSAVGTGPRSAQTAGRWATLMPSAAGIALPAGAPLTAKATPDVGPVPVPILHFSFPDAPEKRLVEQHCVACHDLSRIQNAGGTRSGWTKRLSRMIARGAKLPLQDVPAVAEYLARKFPVRPRPVDANAAASATDAPAP